MDATDFEGIRRRVEEWLETPEEDRMQDYSTEEWDTITEAVQSILEDHPSNWIYPPEEIQTWGGEIADLMINHE